MAIRLVVTDLDGTLIPFGHGASPFVRETLSMLLERGITVILATGRCLDNIPKELWEVKGLRYVISSNGAVVTDRQEGRRIRTALIPEKKAARLLRRLEAPYMYSCAYLDDRMYNRSVLPDFLFDGVYDGRVFQKNSVEDLPSFVEKGRIAVEKIFAVIRDPEKRSDIHSELILRPELQVTRSIASNLEITGTGANKGEALQWLSGHLDIDPSEILAAGDCDNDHSMLRYAGLAVVPGNATEETRRMADEVLADCREESVAAYLRRTLL